MTTINDCLRNTRHSFSRTASLRAAGLISTLLLAATWLGGCDNNTQTADAPVQNESSANSFVTVDGRQFTLHGKPYYFAGANFWYGAYLGAPGEFGDRERLEKELDLLKVNGITNLRVLGLSEKSDLVRAVSPAVIQGKGEYNETLLKGLDFLLAEMAKRDMKAVLYLTNFWQWSGGMSQYVAWFTDTPVMDPDVTGDWNAFMNNSARFYRLEDAQAMYRDAIKMLITRKNTFTGRTYADDPTIMSWQLSNEPRPGNGEEGRQHTEAFENWIHETAKYIDGLAPNQLVSTGNEGAAGSLDDIQLYETAHDSPYVDYLTFHLWLKNWGWFDIENPNLTFGPAMENAFTYINQHIELANKLNKPTVLSEFGVERDAGSFEPSADTVYRDRIFREIYSTLYQRAANGDALAGSNFWSWGGVGRSEREDFMWQEGDDFVGDPPQEPQGLNSVFDTDTTTIGIIRAHADKMNSLSNTD